MSQVMVVMVINRNVCVVEQHSYIEIVKQMRVNMSIRNILQIVGHQSLVFERAVPINRIASFIALTSRHAAT